MSVFYMEPDEIARLIEELKLSAQPDEAFIDLGSTTTINGDINGCLALKKSVVGKIFDTRVVNRQTLLNNLPGILQVIL